MKQEDIIALFQRFEAAVLKHEGIEFWSARDLCPLFGYTKWSNFIQAIAKARESAQAAGMQVSDHFADASKMVSLGSGATRQVEFTNEKTANAPTLMNNSRGFRICSPF